jgi:hypothetical protein
VGRSVQIAQQIHINQRLVGRVHLARRTQVQTVQQGLHQLINARVVQRVRTRTAVGIVSTVQRDKVLRSVACVQTAQQVRLLMPVVSVSIAHQVRVLIAETGHVQIVVRVRVHYQVVSVPTVTRVSTRRKP